MAVANLGIYSAGVAYEVAIEALGQSRQPFMTAIREEKTKENPSQVFIKYCEMRLAAIDEIMDELECDDRDTINRVLDMDHGNPFKSLRVT